MMPLMLLFFPGIAFFTVRWWNPATFEAMHPEGSVGRATWPCVEDKFYLWTWLFLVPLIALHPMANFILPHRQCLTPTKAYKRF